MRKYLVKIDRDGAKDNVLVSAESRDAAERAGVDHWLNGGGLEELLEEHVRVETARAKTALRPDCFGFDPAAWAQLEEPEAPEGSGLA